MSTILFKKNIYWDNIFFKIYLLYHHVKIIQKHKKILIRSTEKNKKISNFFKSIFKTQKQTCFNKKIQPNLKWKKIIITQLLYNIKRVTSIYFLFKNLIREKKKNLKRTKNKIENILKEKKLKEKKLVAGVLSAALLCTIHGATEENTLFKDSDDANTFCAFNQTQNIFTFEKKLLLTCCETQANMLVIILLRNGYF